MKFFAGWPNVLSACKLAEPQTVQDGTPAAASALASALLGSPSRSVTLGTETSFVPTEGRTEHRGSLCHPLGDGRVTSLRRDSAWR